MSFDLKKSEDGVGTEVVFLSLPVGKLDVDTELAFKEWPGLNCSSICIPWLTARTTIGEYDTLPLVFSYDVEEARAAGRPPITVAKLQPTLQSDFVIGDLWDWAPKDYVLHLKNEHAFTYKRSLKM